jgi:hypothetical protein
VEGIYTFFMPPPCSECERLAAQYFACLATLNDAVEADMKSAQLRESTADIQQACQEALAAFQKHNKEAHPSDL